MWKHTEGAYLWASFLYREKQHAITGAKNITSNMFTRKVRGGRLCMFLLREVVRLFGGARAGPAAI